MRRQIQAALAVAVLSAAALVPASAAHAVSRCNDPVPPPSCVGDPPDGTDDSPTGTVTFTNLGTSVRATGWALDPDGGPLQVRVAIDGTIVGSTTANLPNGTKNNGYDVTVPLPTMPGDHRVVVSAANWPDGTTPVAANRVLGFTDVKVALPGPTDLQVSATAHSLWFNWIDNATTETGFYLSVSYDQVVWNDKGQPSRVNRSNTWWLPANPGTGPMSHFVEGLPENTYYLVSVYAVQDGGVHSRAATGNVRTAEY
ncbi:hypothetical protein [Dactylosporangium sp. NPDC000521]|uniref:hypothetical protein n=1 Tax=Dactylosporangium sp. NPDC000521 TaxID=3363975 RepID=UPI0036CAB2C8